MKRGVLFPRDILALIVIVIGSTGFILWGIGLSTIGTATLRWIGATIVALVGFVIALLSRWLK